MAEIEKTFEKLSDAQKEIQSLDKPKRASTPRSAERE
jgi:hypothetical protein